MLSSLIFFIKHVMLNHYVMLSVNAKMNMNNINKGCKSIVHVKLKVDPNVNWVIFSFCLSTFVLFFYEYWHALDLTTLPLVLKISKIKTLHYFSRCCIFYICLVCLCSPSNHWNKAVIHDSEWIYSLQSANNREASWVVCA